jgi:ATP-dependent Lon protease
MLRSSRPIAEGWPRDRWRAEPWGSVELVHNPIEVMELAMEKGAAMALLPVSSRRPLVNLSDDVAPRVQSLFYLDAADALRKALNET